MNRGQRETYTGWLRKGILAECIALAIMAVMLCGRQETNGVTLGSKPAGSSVLAIENEYIKWADFTVSYEALCSAYDWDVKTHGTEHEICWVELLAYTAAKTGGSSDKNALKILEKTAKALSEGEKTMEELTADMKYYAYYREAYDAAIGGLVGEYQEDQEDGSCVQRYGLKGYFPLARGFDYSHYDDFGVSRSYGYKRQHLGHDMMGLVGTPIWRLY